jgi:flavin reductase (DIM6/NTAB) family NADH-FMN oxidoreductase RutF
MAKKNISIDRAHRLLSPGPVALVTSQRKGRASMTPIGWISPVSSRPPMIAIAVYQDHFIHELIRASNEFVLNLPSVDLIKQVVYCGSVSGRDADKFEATGLHVAEPRYVEAPLIDECIGHIECAVVTVLSPGDHSIFIGEVVAVKAESEAFEERWLLTEKELRPLHHLGGSFYGTIDAPFDSSSPPSADERDDS